MVWAVLLDDLARRGFWAFCEVKTVRFTRAGRCRFLFRRSSMSSCRFQAASCLAFRAFLVEGLADATFPGTVRAAALLVMGVVT